ncbi:MAG: TonB-dependent receptor [Candidatus Eiseniibacteriota bacterium]|jgi:outer membrane receptor protein involved in Fe transport
MNREIAHRIPSPRLVLFCISLVCLAALAAGGWTPAHAQSHAGSVDFDASKGVIAGTVTDREFGDVLPRANIVFHRIVNGEREFANGTITWDEGTFEYQLEPGSYEVSFMYVGYETLVVPVEIRAGRRTELEVGLVIEAIEEEAIEVERMAPEDSEAGALVRQREAPVVSETVTSEQIGKTTDSNAADALERVTGLSVVDGKFVFVRGLGDRYSQTQINDAAIGSPEPNKRTVPLDIIPSGLLDNVYIQKTYSPDMDAEFGGGVINVNTKDFVDRRVLRHSVSLGYSSGAASLGRLTYDGGGFSDFLGYDDGTRALPQSFMDAGMLNQANYTLEQLNGFRDQLTNIWTPHRSGSRPNASYSGEFADRYQVLDRDLGVVVSGSFANGVTTRQLSKNDYREFNEQTGTASPESEHEVLDSKESVRFGITNALHYRLSQGTLLKTNLVLTRTTDNRAAISEGYDYDHGRFQRLYSLAFEERNMLSGSITVDHELPLDSKLDWQVGYSQAFREEPDRREVLYEKVSEDDSFEISKRGGIKPVERLFGDTEEYVRTARVNFEMPVVRTSSFQNALKVGLSIRDRLRSEEYRRFNLWCPPPFSRCGDLANELEVTLTDPDAEGRWRFEEFTVGDDRYSGSHQVRAAYGQFDMNLTDPLTRLPLRLAVGARFEDSDQEVRVPGRAVVASNHDDDWAPAANATWALSNRQNLRLSYSETLNRPELRELAPLRYFDWETEQLEQGNTELEQARLKNYDVRWEFYPGTGEYLGAAFFYKDLQGAINKVLGATTGNFITTPQNGDSGLLRGIELEFRGPVSHLWWGMDRLTLGHLGESPGFLRRMGLSANYSLIHSETNTPPPGATDSSILQHTPLLGQSSYTLNLGLYQTVDVFDLSLLYKAFGERLDRIYSLGTDVSGDIYELPVKSLDATVAWNYRRDLKIKLAAENLLDDAQEFIFGDTETDSGLVARRWLPGRKVSLSISYNR